jgi:hypothetical protein
MRIKIKEGGLKNSRIVEYNKNIFSLRLAQYT